MEEQTVETEVAELEAQFDAITVKLGAGETLTNEEGTVLFRVLGGLHSNLTISNEMLHTINAELPNMLSFLAKRIMLRCGRTDSKATRDVEKLCQEYIDNFWTMIRIRAVEVAETIRNTHSGNAEEANPIETNEQGVEQQ